MIKADDQKHAVLRNAVAFLIFGLSNNLHVPLMISASEDIIKMQNNCHHRPQNIVGHSLANNLTLNCLPELGKPRCERMMSTGAVLLADFLPSLTIKLTVAFFMNRIPYSFRHFLVCSLQATSFVLVGISTSIQMSMLGVVFGSAGAGFGEICFLALSSYYDRSTLLAWALGTGASGIVGSVAYAALTEPKLLGVSPQNAILLILIVPAVYFLSYWTILIRPPQVHRAQLLKPSSWIVPAIKAGNQIDCCDDVTSDLKNAGGGTHEFTFVQKIKMIKPLLRYMIPICLVYIMDFLINSGLLQHVKFDCGHSFYLSLSSQFRWFQTFRVLGLFLSRLSALFIEMPSFILYLLPFLQLVNLIIFYSQALFQFIPHIILIFAIIFVEGMIGGECYTFFGTIHRKASPEVKEFSMSVISLGNTIGTTMAGFLSILAHNHICQLYQTIYPKKSAFLIYTDGNCD
ncbi:hypothetical protein GPALN_005844 [Globodera pallida]|nr:hypothetical protein GPALN_005844 [Globodera pallida]